MADRDPEHLHPRVRALLDRHAALAGRHGLFTTLIETYRNEADQLLAWQQGRDTNGNITNPEAVVTYSKPGSSYHGVQYDNGTPCSLAYHLAVNIPEKQLLGFGDATMDGWAQRVYTILGEMGESLGLTWGGRWSLRDWTHFELRVAGKTLQDLKTMIHTLGDIDSLFIRP